jgi:glutaredoxin-like protein NrdH
MILFLNKAKSIVSMEKAYLLTKDNCPQCLQLKMFLKMALKDAYLDQLQEVHQTNDQDLFNTLVAKFTIQATPAIIYQEEVLRGFAPQPVVNFLTKHFGKK